MDTNKFIEEIKVKCPNCMKETYVPTTHGTMVAIKKWVNEHKTRIGRTYCSIDFASIDFSQALSDAIKYGEEKREKELFSLMDGVVFEKDEIPSKLLKRFETFFKDIEEYKLTTSQEEG